jgi:hypothetical protein
LKDAIPDSKSFRDLKEGETFFVSQFNPEGTRVYADEIKITSIDKNPARWIFTGVGKKGAKYGHIVLLKDLDKRLDVWDQSKRYKVFSTFEMDDDPLFELAKKEIKN